MQPDVFVEYGVSDDPQANVKASLFLDELKAVRLRMAKETPSKAEFFDSSFRTDWDSRKTKEKKIKYFNQMSYLNGILMKHELRLKLLASVDGYLAAIESANPLLTFISARYLLELAATVNVLAEDLDAARQTDIRDLTGRGSRFLLALLRARYSSSDPVVSEMQRKFGLPQSAANPININKAIERLSRTAGFSTAISDYDFLSNICHHNGSGHRLFHKGHRETNRVKPPHGPAIIRQEPTIAVTLEYPSEKANTNARVNTAGLAYTCTTRTWSQVEEMPLKPFTEAEVVTLTDGALKHSMNFIPPLRRDEREQVSDKDGKKVGRNDPCWCGSGRKFKFCHLSSVQ